MRKRLFIIVATLALQIGGVGCSHPNPEPIKLLGILPSPGGLPSGGIIVNPDITQPFPPNTQQFTIGEPMNIFIVPDESYKGEVTFLRFTILNTKTHQEVEIQFEPSDWPFSSMVPTKGKAPDSPGDYEFRIYSNGKVVAAQSFTVIE